MSYALAARRAIEREITERTIAAMYAAGYKVAVDYGEESDDPGANVHTADAASVLALMMNLDDAYLTVHDAADGERIGWVRFVYGNDGPDAINDYTVNLEDVLKPINDYTDALMA